MRAVTLHIEGMSCGRASLRYDESVIDPAAIREAVSEAGYHARVV